MSTIIFSLPPITFIGIDVASGRSSRIRQSETRLYETFFSNKPMLSQSRIVQFVTLIRRQFSNSSEAGARNTLVM